MRAERSSKRTPRQERGRLYTTQGMGGELGQALARLAQLRTRAILRVLAQVITGSIAVLSTLVSLTLILSDLFIGHLSTALHTTLMMITLNGLLIALFGGLVALTLFIRRRFTLPRVAEEIERALEARELMPDASRGVISTLTLGSRDDHRALDRKMSALLAHRAIPALNLADRELFSTPWRVLTLILIYSGALSTHWSARVSELSSYLWIAPSTVDDDSLEDELGELSRERNRSRGDLRSSASTETPPVTSQETSVETPQAEDNARRDLRDRVDSAQTGDQARGQADQKQSKQRAARERSPKPSWGSRGDRQSAESPQQAEPRRARARRMSVGDQRTREDQSAGSRSFGATRSMTLTQRDAQQGSPPGEGLTRDDATRDSRGTQVTISERESASIYGVVPQLTPADFPPELSAYVNKRVGEAP